MNKLKASLSQASGWLLYLTVLVTLALALHRTIVTPESRVFILLLATLGIWRYAMGPLHVVRGMLFLYVQRAPCRRKADTLGSAAIPSHVYLRGLNVLLLSLLAGAAQANKSPLYEPNATPGWALGRAYNAATESLNVRVGNVNLNDIDRLNFSLLATGSYTLSSASQTQPVKRASEQCNTSVQLPGGQLHQRDEPSWLSTHRLEGDVTQLFAEQLP